MSKTNVDKVGTEYKKFNNWLRGELKERHIRQKELADYLNIEPSTLSMRLNGQIEWLFRDVLEVLYFLGVGFDEVF